MTQTNEITLKQWVHGEAARLGFKHSVIYRRVSQGKYPALRLRRVNRRVIFVQLDSVTS